MVGEGATNNSRMGFRVRKVEIGYEHFVSIENDLGEDGLTGESIGDAFAVVINQTISIENEVIENREWGFREDDGGDSFDILVGLVAELGDLFVVIDARDFIEMKFGSAEFRIGLDADRGELTLELGETAN